MTLDGEIAADGTDNTVNRQVKLRLASNLWWSIISPSATTYQ